MFLSQNAKYIILDVSTNVQLAILATPNEIISIKKNTLKTTFVSHMVVLISEILKENNLSLKDLSGVIVGRGPGSYIGSRLAVLTSKILSLELGISLFQISSLLLLSSGYEDDIITPKIYAKKDFFYSLSLKNKKIILEESIYETNFLNDFSHHLLLEDQSFKISIEKIFFYMKKVDDVYRFSPNYYTGY
ncbi:tRNA (adenosine(37)-N6)-threonylcarbamoyltransferase complex dimerization subunit type 1 TsaB ['Camptotheca acuminata' phytoplasma]|uniref:tRNA (adenosine(37)-N6)-threonylcarbamoyltransferase complex dimerization subunit type 1 TsaB n=1 Tax='Camptotheca acuminata' phytoplasma TaxID=3239192 RepID=UPI00351A03D0